MMQVIGLGDVTQVIGLGVVCDAGDRCGFCDEVGRTGCFYTCDRVL